MQETTHGAASSWMFRLAALDARALDWVSRSRSQTLSRIMRAVSRTGDTSTVVAGLGLALMLRPGRAAALVTVSTLLALVAFSAAKRLCRRARPLVHALGAPPDRFSMPSGHATCAFAIAGSVSALEPAGGAAPGAWGLAVSASLVVLGVHYPFDVAAGALLGALSAGSVIALSL